MPAVETVLSPLEFLGNGSEAARRFKKETTGLVILNTPISSSDLKDQLWANSSYHVCADGGANRLYDLYQGSENSSRSSCIPEEVHGDLDSIRPEVRKFYEEKKSLVTRDGDQYSTDFQKAVGRVLAKIDSVQNILVVGSLSGRIDHGLGLLSEFYREQQRHTDVRMWLFSETSISVMLLKGTTRLTLPLGVGLVTGNVGIIPVFGPANITLKGFEWDVENWHTEMGGQVSTSNHIKSDEVVVQSDHEVLFTVERST